MAGRQALLLAAHADDETLAAGGTAAKLAEAGWDVRVVIASDGIVRARGLDQDNRAASVRACDTLGLPVPTFLGFPDQALDSVTLSTISARLEALELAPDLVISHADSDLNIDHRILSDVAKIVARPRRKPVSLIAGEVPNVTPYNGKAFEPNFYVDIETQLKRKMDAFACYLNEVRSGRFAESPPGIELLARYRGMEAGLGAAEAFRVIRGYESTLP